MGMSHRWSPQQTQAPPIPETGRRVLLVGEGYEACLGTSPSAKISNAWSFTWVRSALKGLALLREENFEAVVANARLDEMQGTQFLDEVMRRKPHTLRFLVSHIPTMSPSLFSAVGTAHHLVAAPLDGHSLLETLQRASQTDPWSPAESAQELLARFRHLPSPPTLYFDVVRELESEDASMERVGELVSRDMAMTSKLLQVVNSAMFGLKVQVGSASDAVLYLGAETTKALLLVAHTFSYFDNLRPSGLSMEELWRHALITGRFAQCIAEAEGVEGPELSLSFTSGMLHDLGKLALAANLPDKYAQAVAMSCRENWYSWEAEQAIFGVTHGEIGAYLLRIWGLPEDLIEAVALHHLPSQLLNRKFAPITAVHVANVLAHELCSSSHAKVKTPMVDPDYLACLGLSLRLEDWRALCQESCQQ